MLCRWPHGVVPLRWAVLLGALVATGISAQAASGAVASPSFEGPVRVKDLGRLQGHRDNGLIGYGIVTGLAGTGDSPNNRITRQALANVLAQFRLSVAPEQVQSRNVAVVMVSAALPSQSRAGDLLDVTVSSAGDARSLLGGALLMTPLQGPDGRVHALAQGPLAVGGYRYDANGNAVQKNHPTVGAIPGGAVVEVGTAPGAGGGAEVLTFVLHEPDYTTAERLAATLNGQFGAGTAEARDAASVDIRLPPSDASRPVGFLSRMENLLVEPDRRAKVVINERTGTIVAGGDIRLSKVAVTHGDLKVTVQSVTTASQPAVVARTGPDVRTAVLTNTRLDVEEPQAPAVVSGASSVADLVQALARLHIHTRDIISVLRAVKAAGALHADLVVQ